MKNLLISFLLLLNSCAWLRAHPDIEKLAEKVIEDETVELLDKELTQPSHGTSKIPKQIPRSYWQDRYHMLPTLQNTI